MQDREQFTAEYAKQYRQGAKSKEEINAAYDRMNPADGQRVVITRVDLSFGNIFVLAVKFGIVWAILAFIGAWLFSAVH